jgi:type III pantothenate kinase
VTTLLTVDIGNTAIKVGAWEGTSLVSVRRFKTRHNATPAAYASALTEHVDRVVLCSVVPALTGLLADLGKAASGRETMIVTHASAFDMAFQVEQPEKVGVDRLVNASAAKALYGAPALVVDFGTATKFDVVGRDGAFAGGAIAPGLRAAHDALIDRTAQLASVPLHPPPSIIGKNTLHAMQSGIVLGYVALVEGMIARMTDEIGGALTVIATGGDAGLVTPHVTSIQHDTPHLTLEGLRLIYEREQA